MTALLLLALGQQGRIDAAPKLGDVSPAVEANILGSKEKFSLAANRGKRPTVLIFGSCT